MTAPHLLLMFAVSLLGADVPSDFTLSEPPGPYVQTTTSGTDSDSAEDGSARFRAGSPVIATSYFYWYDASTNAHLIDHDGTDALTDHPPTLDGFSYQNVDWHAGELVDMIDAGIDVAMPVYWGTPAGDNPFSDRGLPKLVEARRRLLAEGAKPPSIGMFYDTSTLRHNKRGWHVDLTTEPGRLWFYGAIRNFFSLIPPEHRATIDGKPLVFLYASAFAKKADEKLFPAVRAMFRRDFGTDLFLVKMRGWPGPADSEYQWGAALAPQLLATAGLGPGYDHSAVPGRTPLVRRRDEGRFYEFGWRRLLTKDPATRPWLVHLETWNEFHEGTEICETLEYGRQYIELTRRFADRFHAGQKLDPAEIEPSRPEVRASPERSDGLWIVPMPDGDGPVVEKTVGLVVDENKAGSDGQTKAWSTAPHPFSREARYLYFEVEDYFFYDDDQPIEVTVTYLDAGPDEFRIEYDSADPTLTGLAQQFRPTTSQPIGETKTQKTITFSLPRARFAGRANGADFRLTATHGELVVTSVSVRRRLQPRKP